MESILLVSVTVGISASILSWRERPRPGSISLVVMLVGQVWWSITILFRLNAADLNAEIFWLELSWVGTVIIPVAWLFFCLEYTGLHRYVNRRNISLLSIIPILTVVISLTNSYHHLLYLDRSIMVQSRAFVRAPGVWFWVIAGYTYLLGIVGAIPLLQFLSSEVEIFRGQSLALLAGLVVPWLTNILYISGVLPTAGVDPTPAAFSFSGVAYLGAITRFQLFETNPAPIKQAHFTYFDQMQDGIVVIDGRKHVIEANKKTEEIFDKQYNEILGHRIDEVIPNINTVLTDQSETSQTIFWGKNGNIGYDISVTKLTDSRGETTGHIITLHEISEYLRQQQRLEVLNRVFRHNIRTNTQVIIGKAEYLENHNSKKAAETVEKNALEIEQISEKVRTVLDIFEQSRERTQIISLNGVLRDCIFQIEDQYPDVTVDTNFHAENGYVNKVLETVFLNLIENAAEHNTSSDPQIHVEVISKKGTAKVVVADNGPGIDEQELSLLEEGKETALKHGTGFGLAIIIWGTAIAGGEISFEENDPTGLVVTVEVPLYDEDNHSQDIHLPVENH